MRKTIFYRILFYAVGLLVLALGLTLNTKTGLGVSPIISVAYSISQIFDHNFGNMTLGLYSVFVVIEMILHLIRDRRYSKEADGVLAHAGKKDLKLILLMDFLQIPLSIVFTRFLNVFSAVIPNLYSEGKSSAGELAVREDGAECILLGCAGFVDFVEDLSQKLGVPVLDGVMPAVKFAEAMVDMRLTTSKVSTWGYPENKEIVGLPMFTKEDLTF